MDEAARTAAAKRDGIDGDAVPRAEARVALALERRAGIDQREVDVEEDGGDPRVRSRKRSVVRPRDDHRGLRGIDGAPRRLVHLVARDRLQQSGHTDIVVEPETEELRASAETWRCRRWSRAFAAASRSGTASTRAAPVRSAHRSTRPVSSASIDATARSTFAGLTPARTISGPGSRLASSELKT